MKLRSILVWTVCTIVACHALLAQGADAPQTQPAMVELSFPDNVDLKILIDYVGKRQGVNFLYDEQIAAKKVTIKTPMKVPSDSLMTLLDSVLMMKGLGMYPTDVPGMIRIEAAKGLQAIAEGPTTTPGASTDARPMLAQTRIFELHYAAATQVEQVIKPFLSASTANLTILPEHRIVIITDYAANMKRIEDLLALVDKPGRDVQVKFVTVKYIEAATVAQKVKELLAGKTKSRGVATSEAATDSVFADDRTNQVVIVGSADQLAEAVSLIQSLDVPLRLETKTYSFTVVSAERVDRLTKELIGELAAKRFYKSATDFEGNVLIATTTPEIHEQIESLRKMLDKPAVDEQSPIRFYKLENARAAELLTTLQNIEGDAGLQAVNIDGATSESQVAKDSMMPAPPEIKPTADQVPPQHGIASGGQKGHVLDTQQARVMADEPSNTIIVIAKPAMQLVYEKLIKRLDVRRPQVQIEATVVSLDTTNDFSLGVEISRTTTFDNGKGKTLTFGSFGLSTVDPATGALTLKPGIGFNGALLHADIADAVIRALETDKRVKVLSSPSVLVNDNATGTLLSENEEPFASVNASSTVATTSFGGYSSAGTKITIKPQISEGDYLKLKYEITLSSFGEDRTDSLPPSRQRNSLTSEVTVPSGDTIVVGGLSQEKLTKTVDRIPGLGRMPIMEYLFSNRSNETRKTTLFVFIRAVILRDDKFEALKVLSSQAASRARLASGCPVSEPVAIQ